MNEPVAHVLFVCRPRIGLDEARRLAFDQFGVTSEEGEGTMKVLSSYEDMNFWIRGKFAGAEVAREMVLKVHNEIDSDVSRAGFLSLKAQEEVLNQIQNAVVPKSILPGRHVEIDGNMHFVRLLSFIPGRILFEEKTPQDPGLLQSFGRCLAVMDKDLQRFQHPGSKRFLIWDIRHSKDTISRFRNAIQSHEQNNLIDRAIKIIEEQVLTRANSFRMSTIHGDANDHNVIFDANGTKGLVGFIDFGDLCETWLVAEVAIAMCYVMIAETTGQNKVEQARHVLFGYCRELPLLKEEEEALFGLIVSRLALSVSISATDSAMNPENASYTLVHANGAWNTLATLLKHEKQGTELFISCLSSS